MSSDKKTQFDGPAPSAEIDRRRLIGSLALGIGATPIVVRPGPSQAQTSTSTLTGQTIVVTAPTGDIGTQVVENLLASGTSAQLRLIVRDPSRLPAELRERVEVVQGSHSDAAVVGRAFEGADAMFWLCPPDPRAQSVMEAYVDFTRPASEAIRRHGVRRVVGISALGRGTPMAASAGLVTASLVMDDLLAGTGAGYRALTMPSFMDNLLRQVAPIRNQGAFFLPISGDRRMPSCATRDIAAVASRLLLDTSWSGQGDLAVLGPEDLSFNDMARIMSEVLDRPIRYQQVSFEAYRSGFVQRGMSEAMAHGMTDMARAKDEGLDNSVRRTAENTTPTGFRQWCREVLRPAMLA